MTRLNGEKIQSWRRTAWATPKSLMTTVFSPEIMKARPRSPINVPNVNTSD